MGLVSENLLEMLHARGVVKEGAKCTPMLRLGDWLAINALSMEDALAVVEGFFSVPYLAFSPSWRAKPQLLEDAPKWALFSVDAGRAMVCLRPPTREERALYQAHFGELPLYITDSEDVQTALLSERLGMGFGYLAEAEKIEDLETYLKAGAGSVDALIGQLLADALAQEATDIHLAPNKKQWQIDFRLSGERCAYARLPLNQSEGLLNKLKLLGEMDIAEHRLPQDGHVRLRYKGKGYNLRLSTMPLYEGEKMVIRVLPEEKRLTELAELGFLKEQEDLVQKVLQKREGLVLFTGPTNSGKTTSLYACLSALAFEGALVYTIEDPIEAVVEGVEQMQVNEKSGLNFARGLRGMLRADPDVMAVGELRDAETVEMAARAALSGHLVLATLHSFDAQGAVSRLRDLGLSDIMIATVLRLVVASRLYPKPCDVCGGTGMVDGVCCAGCMGSGTHGRTAALELWALDESAAQAIAEGKSSAEMREGAIKKGFVTLAHDAMQKGLLRGEAR